MASSPAYALTRRMLRLIARGNDDRAQIAMMVLVDELRANSFSPLLGMWLPTLHAYYADGAAAVAAVWGEDFQVQPRLRALAQLIEKAGNAATLHEAYAAQVAHLDEVDEGNLPVEAARLFGGVVDAVGGFDLFFETSEWHLNLCSSVLPSDPARMAATLITSAIADSASELADQCLFNVFVHRKFGPDDLVTMWWPMAGKLGYGDIRAVAMEAPGVPSGMVDLDAQDLAEDEEATVTRLAIDLIEAERSRNLDAMRALGDRIGALTVMQKFGLARQFAWFVGSMIGQIRANEANAAAKTE